MQKKNSAWYYNRSKRDIVIAELDLTLKSGQVADLYSIKPTLRQEFVRYSESYGVLKKCVDAGKLLKLKGPPKKEKKFSEPKYQESKEMLVTRVRSCVEVNPKDKDFIESLDQEFLDDVGPADDSKRAAINDKFLEEFDLDGFDDPLAEDENI